VAKNPRNTLLGPRNLGSEASPGLPWGVFWVPEVSQDLRAGQGALEVNLESRVTIVNCSNWSVKQWGVWWNVLNADVISTKTMVAARRFWWVHHMQNIPWNAIQDFHPPSGLYSKPTDNTFLGKLQLGTVLCAGIKTDQMFLW